MAVKRRIKDRYDTLDVIGKGGMGLVYKAYDTVVAREVALKTLRDSPSKMALDLFRKECGILASMSHPNIVEIFDIGEFQEDGATKPYFVMPLLPGVTLDQLIRTSSQRLTVDRTVEIMLQTCRGLHAAHERGLVHRDLKPSNIFVMPDDSIKIIDFGVAHMADTTNTMTVAGGTLPYMAPEQLEMKPASPLSDIFSLGVVFYETLTRRRPFDFPTEQETAQAILHHIPPAASDLNPAVSQVISRVIHKAIAKQPWNRFSTAKEFAETLVKAQRNESIEIFDTARLQPRIQKATKAYETGNFQFAAELLNELEAEGHVETTMTLLRRQLDQAVRQKTIGQLLDSARNCMDEEEYLLALQKIQEILQLDPTNSSALTLKSSIETRRSEAKVEEWVKLARQHLENNAFSHAREALQNLLQLRPKDTTALQLLAEADRREEAYVKARKQKEELYKLALEAWQNGEMSSALTKLERLVDLDKRVPDTSAPERGISYQNFYNQVRTEHDVLQSSYQEARKHLVDGNFTSALSICEQYLNKYPGHALFQALKFDVEERHRQELSSRIAEIDRSVESEPDIDRRVSILKEALKTYPGEPHFEKALRLVRDKRDLVNSIVAKARAYDERGQFTEALGQWEILQTIHKQYPGLDFEIDRVRKRRDQQSRNEAKARWVEQVDRQLEAGDYEHAIELLRNAETEFPGDPEMTALGELARQSQARAAEAAQIFSQGQELSTQRRFDEAIEQLRRAADMDPHNRVIRGFLLETLLEHARAVLDTDWHAAETLSQQALDLDPDHALAKGVRTMALDRKREEEVGKWVAEARRNQAAGNVQAALAQIEQGLAAYPREPRLTQLHATLCKAIPDLQSRAEAVARGTAFTQHQSPGKPTAGAADTAPAGWDEFEQKLRAQGESAAAAETLAVAAGAGSPVAASGPTVDASAETQVVAHSPTEAEAPPANVVQPAPGAELGATMLFRAPAPDAATPPPAAPVSPAPPAVAPKAPKKPPVAKKEAKPQPPPGPPKPVNKTLIGIGAGAVVVLIAAWFIASAFRSVTIVVQTNPPGASIRINNEPRGTSNLSLKLRAGTYQLLAEKEGYIPVHMPLVVKRGSAEPIKLNLQAVPPPAPVVELHQLLRLSSDLQSGKVKVDDQPAVELTDGQLPDQELTWGKHDIEISSGSARTSITFEAASGRPPVLAEAPKTKELNAVVVTSLGNQAHIQASQSSTPVKVTVDKQDQGELGPGGLDLPSLPLGNHEVVLNDGKNPHTLNITTSQAPSLQVQLYSDRNVGSVLIQAGVDDATVEVDGKPTKRKTNKAGQVVVNLGVKQHSIRVLKNGFLEEPAQTVEIKKGEEAKLEFHLRPVPTVAGLTIHGAAPGLQVTFDQKHAGTVAGDGSLSLPGIAPGNHTIELTDGRRHKLISKDFKAGETLVLGPPDVILQAAKGSVKIAVSPASASVSYKGPDGRSHEVRGPSVDLEEGPYTFSASASGFNDAIQNVMVASNRPNLVTLTLTAKVNRQPIAGPVTMEQWAATAGWKADESWFVHHGGGLVLYPAVPSSGTFIFTALRQGGILGSGRIRWVAGCIENTSTYVLFEIDKKNIHRSEMEAGKKVKGSDKSTALKNPAGKELQYNIKVDISSGGVITSVQQGNDWVVVDNWSASGANPASGKFGFYLPGTDELYISHFSFTPK